MTGVGQRRGALSTAPLDVERLVDRFVADAHVLIVGEVDDESFGDLSAHAQFKVDTGVAVYFADPHSPWQRGTNENTNGLLRQYFPKGTDLSRWSLDDLLAVQAAINSRPRKVLGWMTPAEVLDEQLRLLHQAGVARTG